MSVEKQFEADPIVVKDDDSDCEIVESTPGLVDVPDLIDPMNLDAIMSEPKESLPPIVEKIVSNLSNDEEFEKECDKFYKANLEMDVEIVQVDVAKVLSQTVHRASPPAKKINLSAGIDDIRTTRDLTGICDLCKQDSQDHVELLIIHFKDGHQLKDGLFVCPFCDYTSLKYEIVMKHTTKVHKLVSEKRKCDQCDFETFRGDLFNRHTNNHLKEKVYSCEICNYKTINLANFKRHLNSKHTKETEYFCQFCDFRSTTQGVVKKHENSKHTREKIYSCDKCTYKTTLSHALKRHQERHCKNRGTKAEKGDKNKFTYVCVHCTFKTESLTALDDHTLMNHPKKEILFCNLCEFSTTENTELNEHARTHLKKEPEEDGAK
ncbi:hypothetical protein HHI36_021663 [Cryptolaemus montrouzieri]|uniref:Protein hunchback n=1 Tax=Cryptolaemus montrouzieri TaxID=559131 RepID=A0ABD2MYB0_9CUCU